MKTTFTLLISCLLSFLLQGTGSLIASELKASEFEAMGSETKASMIIADVEAVPGEEVTIPITVEGFEKVNVIQIYLYFNKSVTRCISVENLHPSVSNAMTNINDSLFMLSWYNISRSANIPDGGKLLDLRFKFCTDAAACEANDSYTDLFFIPSHTFINGPGPDFESIPLTLVNGSISARDMSVVYLDVDVEGKGNVMVDGNAYSGPVSAEAGSTLSLDAVPEGDWVFEGWSGAVSGSSSSVDILMDGDREVSAKFVEPEPETPDPEAVAVTFNLYDEEGEGVTGATITLDGNTNAGGSYSFDGVLPGTYDFKVVKTGYQSQTGQIEVNEEDVTKDIVLKEKYYTVDFEVADGNGGLRAQAGGESIASGEKVQEGRDVRFTADPADGYAVKEWWINGSTVSGNTNKSLTIKDLNTNTHVAVEFAQPTYRLTVLAGPEEGGFVEVSPERSSYEAGTKVTLKASAAETWQFVHWKGQDGKVRSTNSSYTHTIASHDEILTAVFETAGYQISTTASPRSGGSVSGSGGYTHGEEVTVEASPAEGYYFVNWTENGGELTSEKSFSFTADKNRDLVANFGRFTYDVVFDVRDDHGETIEGARVTLGERTNAPGDYSFSDISFGSHTYKVEKTGYTSFEGELELSDNHTEVVNLGIQTFVVDFAVDGSNGTITGRVSGEEIASGDLVQQGQEVKFSALPDEDYQVSQWTLNGEVVPEESGNSFTMDELSENVSVGVSFEDVPYELTMVVEPEGAGDVGADPDLEHYKAGDRLNLSANAAEGYDFLHWVTSSEEKVESTEASFSYVMPGQDVSMKAVFEIRTYDITVAVVPQGGGFRLGGGTYDHGERVTVEAVPAGGYSFINWTENDREVSANRRYSFNANKDRKLVANFSADTPETYTVHFDVVCEKDEALADAVVVLDDIENAPGDYTFKNVKPGTYNYKVEKDGFVSGSGEVEVHQGDVTEKLILAQRRFAVDFGVDGDGGSLTARADGTTIEPGGQVGCGESVSFKAEPDTHYRIDSWILNGETVNDHKGNTLVVDDFEDDLSVRVSFAPVNYRLTLNATPANAGRVRVNPDQTTYRPGDEIRTEADAETGYDFVHWVASGEKVESTEASFTFTMPGEDVELTAVFELRTYQIDAVVASDQGGEVSGQGEWTHGDEVTLTARPSEGHRFKRWTEDGSEVSADESYSFIAESERSLEAHFAPLTWKLSFRVQCTGGNEIPDAVVTLDGETFGEGQYDFDGLLSGTYHYTIKREGYAPQEGSVSLSGDDVVESVGLEPDAEPPVDEPEPFEMKVYPNPASEHVWVEFNNKNTFETTLVLYNMEGRVVKQERISQTGNIQARLELYDLAPGLYMLTIQGEKTYPVKRLLIR